MKKEKSKYAGLWYLFFVLTGAFVGLLAGVSADGAVDENDRIDITKMKMPEISSVETYKRLFDDKSKARTGAFAGGFIVTIIILQITTNRKRFHRHGVEHGSAEWGGLTEKKKLADKGVKPCEDKGFMALYKFKSFISLKKKKKYRYIYVKMEGGNFEKNKKTPA